VKLSRTGIIISALPSLAMLALFYSLAIHMRYTLGAWPASIGNRGFPPALVMHGDLAWMFCGALVVATVCLVPVAVVVCLIVPPWRGCINYYVLYVVFYLVGWGLMLLAPHSFLHWWWD
jgi:hypothetical protein